MVRSNAYLYHSASATEFTGFLMFPVCRQAISRPPDGSTGTHERLKMLGSLRNAHTGSHQSASKHVFIPFLAWVWARAWLRVHACGHGW